MRELTQNQVNTVAGGFSLKNMTLDLGKGVSEMTPVLYDAVTNFQAKKYVEGVSNILHGLGILANTASRVVHDVVSKDS